MWYLTAGSWCWPCGCLKRSSLAGGGGGGDGGRGWSNTGSAPSAMFRVS